MMTYESPSIAARPLSEDDEHFLRESRDRFEQGVLEWLDGPERPAPPVPGPIALACEVAELAASAACGRVAKAWRSIWWHR